MSKDLDMLNRIRHAWDRVIKKGRELGKRSYTVEGSYHQWLCERVKKVKLPFRSSVPVIEETKIQDPMSLEEIEELKKELEESKNEKEALKKELIRTHQEHKASQEEITKVKKYVELANKRARIEEERKLNTRSCLEAAATELKLQRGERDEARVNSERWREAWEKAKEAERSAQRQLEDLKQKLKRVVAEYESRVQDEKPVNANLVLQHQATLNARNQHIMELVEEVRQLRNAVEIHEANQRFWARNLVN
ncbi:spindle pole body component 110-like [Cajanus cajan]|nr:spindle pole body component 110-like [Cajanus cajan]